MNDWQKALMIISFWILIQICIRLMKKNRAIQQDLPILGKPYCCFNDILFYFSLKDSKGLSLIKSSVDKL